MEYIIRTTILGLFFGTFGTTIGGAIGLIFGIYFVICIRFNAIHCMF